MIQPVGKPPEVSNKYPILIYLSFSLPSFFFPSPHIPIPIPISSYPPSSSSLPSKKSSIYRSLYPLSPAHTYAKNPPKPIQETKNPDYSPANLLISQFARPALGPGLKQFLPTYLLTESLIYPPITSTNQPEHPSGGVIRPAENVANGMLWAGDE